MGGSIKNVDAEVKKKEVKEKDAGKEIGHLELWGVFYFAGFINLCGAFIRGPSRRNRNRPNSTPFTP